MLQKVDDVDVMEGLMLMLKEVDIGVMHGPQVVSFLRWPVYTPNVPVKLNAIPFVSNPYNRPSIERNSERPASIKSFHRTKYTDSGPPLLCLSRIFSMGVHIL